MTKANEMGKNLTQALDRAEKSFRSADDAEREAYERWQKTGSPDDESAWEQRMSERDIAKSLLRGVRYGAIAARRDRRIAEAHRRSL